MPRCANARHIRSRPWCCQAKPADLAKCWNREVIQGYFGWRFGLPPGLPGGGITGVLPASGVGARISGSTPDGGHSTPFDLASLSPKGSPACPVVVPGSRFGRGSTDFALGAQLLARVVAGGGGGAVSRGA